MLSTWIQCSGVANYISRAAGTEWNFKWPVQCAKLLRAWSKGAVKLTVDAYQRTGAVINTQQDSCTQLPKHVTRASNRKERWRKVNSYKHISIDQR